MRVSYRWLRSLIALEEPPQEVASVLTGVGLEVEEVTEYDPHPLLSDKVVIGWVRSVRPHPRADKLKVTEVDVGGGEVRQIVCGAPNVAEGQKVVVALPGARVRSLKGEEITLKRAKLRGEVSEGMIVAETEVGLGDDAEGIKVLPADAPVGVPMREWLGVEDDWVLEVALTPNRGDAASHWGIARDLSAYYDRDLSMPPVSEPPKEGTPWKIHLPRPEACPRYVGIGIGGVRPIPSPPWLRRRLEAVGITPRNVLVDLTNYILYELGQPLHAFDMDRLPESAVEVDFARPGEAIEALDGKVYELSPEVLTIRSGGVPVAVAGIIGGAGHSVNDGTRRIFLESAYFDPMTIRRGVRRLGIHTDASFRYERGTDPAMVPVAVARYWHLIRQVFPEARIEAAYSEAYPNPIRPAEVDFDLAEFERWSGFPIAPKRAARILYRMGFEGADAAASRWRLKVPTAKHDVQRPVDVVEELLRIEGMEKIPLPSRVRFPLNPKPLPKAEGVRQRIEAFLIGQGFHEAVHNSIIDAGWLTDPTPRMFGEPVRLLNPSSSELNALRTSLMFPALWTVRHNLRHGRADFRLWEWGRVYRTEGVGRYAQEERLALWAVGRRARPTPHHPPLAADFFYLKGVLDGIWRLTRTAPRERVGQNDAAFAQWVEYSIDDVVVGWLGIFSLAWLADRGIEAPVVMAELRWEELRRRMPGRVRYRPFGRFPVVVRDLAVLMPEGMPWERVRSAVVAAGGPLLQEVFVFDVYAGKRLPAGRKSVAFRLHFYDPKKTLREREVDRTMQRIIRAVEGIGDVAIRG